MKKLITLLALTLLTASTAIASTFSDTTTSNIYYDSIEFLAQEDIINGNPDGTFAPSRTLNRAELLKIIVEANYPPTQFEAYGSDNCFDDVPANQWYTAYVCFAKDNGWVVGYDNGKNFKPAQAVTFVEALKMTLKAFAIPFTEPADVWYRDAVNVAGNNNYIPIDIMAFQDPLQRDQMADLVTRIIKDQNGELEDWLMELNEYVVTYETIENEEDVYLEYLETFQDPMPIPGGTELLFVTMEPMDTDPHSGEAIFAMEENNVVLDIQMFGYTEYSVRTANIQYGTCESPGEVAYSLEDLLAGFSSTVFDESWEQLLSEFDANDMIINIVTSEGDSNSCGQIIAAQG